METPTCKEIPMWSRVGMILVLLGALALRLHRIAVQEIRGDEAFTYFFSRQPVAMLALHTVQLREPHPIGSYLVERAWMSLAGDSLLSLRFPSVATGVLTVALLHAVTRALGLSRLAAGGATAAAALSAYLIWHSQDARMYSMGAAVTTALVWVTLHALRTRKLRWYVAYVLLGLVALHLHYYTAFLIVGLNVYVLVLLATRHLPWTFARAWFMAHVALGTLYMPWLWYARDVFVVYRGTGESPSLADMLWRSLSVIVVGESVPLRERQVYAILAVFLLTWGLAHTARRAKRVVWDGVLLLCWLGVPLIGAWAAAWHRPLFNERYLVFAAPPWYILVGALLDALHCDLRRSCRLTLRGMLLAVLLFGYAWGNGVGLYRYFYRPEYNKIRGWRELAAVLDRWSWPMPSAQVRLAQNYPDPSLWYYYRGPVSHVVLPPRAGDEAAAHATVQDLVASGVAWVILAVQPSPQWDPDGLASRALAKQFVAVWESQVATWRVHLYARPLPEAWQPVDVRFRNGYRLESVQVQPERVYPEVPLVVYSRWQIPTGVHDKVKAFIHLVPIEGSPQPLAQCDPEMPTAAGEHTLSCGFLVPSSLPEGEYRLLIGLYLPEAPGMPRVPTSTGEDAVPVAVLARP